MPTVNIDENIKKVTQTIEQMTQEIFRLQGMLQTFRDLEKIDDDSTQEKPE